MKHILMMIIMLAMVCSPVSSATLEWDANPDAVMYQVFVRDADGAEWMPVGEPTRDTKIDIPSMPVFNKVYAFTVKARNECGNTSDFAEPVTHNPCMAAIMETVKNMRVSIHVTVEHK